MAKPEFQYLQVSEKEGEEAIELPTEEDGTLLLTTLVGQYPGTTGLKYRNPTTKTIRGIRLVDGRLQPPEDGWSDTIYYCSFSKDNKRKLDDVPENSPTKTRRVESKRKCTDLIVLGLPYRFNDENLRKYFEEFGEVLIAQMKQDPKTGQSKGFGFIHFSSYEVQERVLEMQHLIDGRWCNVKIPDSKMYTKENKGYSDGERKGRCSDLIVLGLPYKFNDEDLREYFEEFGDVTSAQTKTDKKTGQSKGFGFVRFSSYEAQKRVLAMRHMIGGRWCNVKIPHSRM